MIVYVVVDGYSDPEGSGDRVLRVFASLERAKSWARRYRRRLESRRRKELSPSFKPNISPQVLDTFFRKAVERDKEGYRYWIGWEDSMDVEYVAVQEFTLSI